MLCPPCFGRFGAIRRHSAPQKDRERRQADERGQAELGPDLLRPRIRNAPWFIHCLIVPNGCSTVSRRPGRAKN